MLQRLRLAFRRIVFLENRPESGEIFLHQRRVFTLPNQAGLALCGVLLLLLAASINYNLSLGFALTFVLGATALVNTFFTFRNLAWLHLQAGSAASVFAGEEARFTVHLSNRRQHARYALWIGFAGHAHQAVDLAAESRCSLQLSLPTHKRGYLAMPRVELHTSFPLGILRAWSTWLPDTRALVYPQPEVPAPPLPQADSAQQDGDGQAGAEDFAGVRAYQRGDPMKHLAWKQIARIDSGAGGALVSKSFAGGAAAEIALDFSSLPRSMDLELKLARMTAWVLQAEAGAQPYAFRLGALNLDAACGQAQRDACLQALALYGETP